VPCCPATVSIIFSSMALPKIWRTERQRIELAAYCSAVPDCEGYTLEGTSVRANTRTSSLLGKLTLRTVFVLSRWKE
jgi:hypothetical protein